MYPVPHHHGRDGECHPGLGGMFYCPICERDRDNDDDDDEEAGDERAAGMG